MQELLIRNLRVALAGKEILRGIDLEVKKGEFISLLGPSGCGKTTFIKTVAGLLKPNQGDIFICGQSANQLVPEKRGTVIVFQDLRLFPNLNVQENIEFGLRMKGVNKMTRQQKALDILEKVEMSGFEKRKINSLSGGQKQRVALARAIAAEPGILLLDEPYSSLDENIKQKMIELVLKLHRDLKMTTIMVTHDQQEALLMSDRIAVMKAGLILQYDTAKNIYDSPISPTVADYLGKTNYLEGIVDEGIFRSRLGECKVQLEGGRYQAMLRPTSLKILPGRGNFQVQSVSFLGDRYHVIAANQEVDFLIATGSDDLLEVGDHIGLEADFTKSVFFRKEGGV